MALTGEMAVGVGGQCSQTGSVETTVLSEGIPSAAFSSHPVGTAGLI